MRHGAYDGGEDESDVELRSDLAALSAGREPSALLRVRTIAALRERGLLDPAPVRRGRDLRDGRRRVARAVGFVAAASVVFLAGGTVGYSLALSRTARRSGAVAVRIAAETVPATQSAPQVVADRHIVWF